MNGKKPMAEFVKEVKKEELLVLAPEQTGKLQGEPGGFMNSSVIFKIFKQRLNVRSYQAADYLN